MIELTEEQRQEFNAAEPVAIDPQTRETYVLVRREAYERLQALLALDDYNPDEGAGHINEVMAEAMPEIPTWKATSATGKTDEPRRRGARAVSLSGPAGGEGPPWVGDPVRCREPASHPRGTPRASP